MGISKNLWESRHVCADDISSVTAVPGKRVNVEAVFLVFTKKNRKMPTQVNSIHPHHK